MNRRFLILSVVIPVLILSGCSMAPKYEQPAMPVDGNWPSGLAYINGRLPADAPVGADVAWQQFFVDDKLQKVIEIALENNRDLRLAALNVEKAKALYGVQEAELLPSVDATGKGSKTHTATDLTAAGTPRTTKKYSVDFGITAWEIDFFNRIGHLKERALREYLATDQARRSARIALLAETARVYFTLAADMQKLSLAQSTLDAQMDSYNLIEKQYQASITNELDLRRAQTQVDTARVDVASYTQLVAKGQNALNLLAGTTVPSQFLPLNLETIAPLADISAGLPSDVLLRRPDIIAAEHRLKGAYAYIGAARAAFFPRISLTTAMGTASNEFSNLFGAGNGTWNFSPQIVMPLFDARTWAAFRVSKAERNIAVAEYEKTIQVAFKEVADSLAVRGTVDQQVSAQQAVVDAAEKIYTLSRDRYNNGIDSYLSVLDAQRSMYSAQQGLITLQLSKFANEVQFYAVVGGGGGQAESDELKEK